VELDERDYATLTCVPVSSSLSDRFLFSVRLVGGDTYSFPTFANAPLDRLDRVEAIS